MLIEQDTETGACYFTFTDHDVERTVHVDDLVMIDLDSVDEPVGIEFAAPPTETDWKKLHDCGYPQIEQLVSTLLHRAVAI